MTWEGAKVELVCELMPYSSGLNRNIVQCVMDNDIPLKFNHTVTRIHGKERVEGVTISEVDPATRKPIEGTEQFYPCDTLLLSVGLIPENELSRAVRASADGSRDRRARRWTRRVETSIPGVFACGNVLHVHDLVDNVSMEAAIAGRSAAAYAARGEACPVRAARGSARRRALCRPATHPRGRAGRNPAHAARRRRIQRRDARRAVRLKPSSPSAKSGFSPQEKWKPSPWDCATHRGRHHRGNGGAKGVKRELICIVCPMGCHLTAEIEGDTVAISGNTCPRGERYGRQEILSPELRMATSSVAIGGSAHALCPVKTAAPVPKAKVGAVLAAIRGAHICAPVKLGDVILANVAGVPWSLRHRHRSPLESKAPRRCASIRRLLGAFIFKQTISSGKYNCWPATLRPEWPCTARTN